jgi:hypothetical protein
MTRDVGMSNMNDSQTDVFPSNALMFHVLLIGNTSVMTTGPGKHVSRYPYEYSR